MEKVQNCSSGRESALISFKRKDGADSHRLLQRFAGFARIQHLLISALLATAVLAIYAPVTGYDFIALDDAAYVRENRNINAGFTWAGLQWALKNPVAGNWHPVTMLSHMADCQLYGLYAGGHHLTNVLLHIANTLLLFWTLLALFDRSDQWRLASEGKKSEPRDASSRHSSPVTLNIFWVCVLVAALFGLHPLRVESVAWIAERKDVLSGFFFMLTLWAYARFAIESKSRNPKSKVFYICSLSFFALGLMSKPMLVTVPFVFLLLDFWPLDRFKAQDSSAAAQKLWRDRRFKGLPLILEKIPFFALAAIFSAITFFIQKNSGAVVELNSFSLQARLANIMVCYAVYLGKIFWPHPLAMLYPYHDWTSGQITGSIILFAGISLAAIFLRCAKPWLFVGWFWFAGMMVPVVGLVQVGIQSSADRYTYLPSIGIFIALTWALADWVARESRPRDFDSRATNRTPVRWRALTATGAILVVALLAIASAAQVRYWKNTETLFEHSLQITGNNTEAHYILGALLESRGKTDEAFSEFTQSLRDNANNAKALGGLAYILFCGGRFDEAVEQYRAAVRIEPNSAKVHFGLAEVLRMQHKDDEAIEQYSLALRFEPKLAEVHYQLAGLYAARHDAAAAIAQLRETVRLAPDWFLALNNLAWMLATEPDANLRNGSEATRMAIRAAVAAGRNNPNALDTLAAAYAETGRFADAVQTAQCAVRAADTNGQTNLATEINSRLKLYQSRQAFRE